MRTLGLPPFPGHKANLTTSEQNLSKVNHIEEISSNIGQNLSRTESHRRNRAYHKQPFQNLIKKGKTSQECFSLFQRLLNPCAKGPLLREISKRCESHGYFSVNIQKILPSQIKRAPSPWMTRCTNSWHRLRWLHLLDLCTLI